MPRRKRNFHTVFSSTRTLLRLAASSLKIIEIFDFEIFSSNRNPSTVWPLKLYTWKKRTSKTSHMYFDNLNQINTQILKYLFFWDFFEIFAFHWDLARHYSPIRSAAFNSKTNCHPLLELTKTLIFSSGFQNKNGRQFFNW